MQPPLSPVSVDPLYQCFDGSAFRAEVSGVDVGADTLTPGTHIVQLQD
jgi:hypothetical protein